MSQSVEQLERAVKVYKGLVEVSSLINAITNFDDLLSAILDVAWRVMRAEASSLFLVDEQGDLRLAIARGPDGGITKPNIVVPRGRGIAGWVCEHNEPLLVPDAYTDPRFFREADLRSGFKTRSILCVPLFRESRIIGVLQVLNPTDRPAFNGEDLDAFHAYGHLAATAIDKLRVMERQAQQALVEQELVYAREIQRSFLPHSLPSIAGIDFGATYRPALNISGDFYDVVEAGPDEIYFVVGDVSGKGVPAALLMAQSVSYLRLIVRAGINPNSALAQWNEALCGHTVRGMFVTAIVGRVEPSRRHIEFSSAGHPPPLRSTESGVKDVPMKSSPPVGIVPGMTFASNAVDLDRGDWLVFYTDGLVESFGADDTLLGREGVKRLLAGACSGAEEIVARLTRGEAAHRQGAAPHDDLTVLVFGFR